MSSLFGKVRGWYLVVAGVLWLLLLSPVLPDDWWDKLRSNKETLKLYKQVVRYVQAQYVDPQLIDPKLMLVESLASIQKTIPEVLFFHNEEDSQGTLQLGDKKRVYDLKDIKDFPAMLEVMGDAQQSIVSVLKGDIEDEKDVEYAAIRGMLGTLDPHSTLLTPEVYKEMQIGTSGKFGGLGIVISVRKGKLTVINPIPNTPAHRKGLKPKDVIVKIDDESTINMALTDAVGKMRGKPGTDVSLTIQRPGLSDMKVFVLTREIIKIESVQSTLLAGNVAYARLKAFQKRTAEDLQDAVASMSKQAKGGLKGFILDLRNNPGGLLDQAVAVSDVFLEDGVIVTTVAAQNKFREYEKAKQGDLLPKLPLIVLTNGGSASGSEIVAGAIKNNNRGIVLGSRTFGKGTVQTVVNLSDDTGLKLTIAKYLTPGNKSIQSVGIPPDIFLSPAIVDASSDTINLFWHQRHMAESDLKRHFRGTEEQQTQSEPPRMKLTYLSALTPEDRDEAVVVEEVGPQLEQNDPEVRIAKALILANPRVERGVMLDDLKTPVLSLQAQEMEKISKKLEPLGIDWIAGKEATCKAEQVSFSVVQKGQGPIVAGTPVVLEIKAENKGDTPCYRLHGLTDSDTGLFDDKEVIFGRLDAHKAITRELKMEVSKNTATLLEMVTIRFRDQFDESFPDAKVMLKIKSGLSPVLAYRYQLAEDKGNGDGIPQKGESFNLQFEIANRGQAEAQDIVAMLVNKSGKGVFLANGRLNLGKLPPKATKQGVFKLEVKEALEGPLKIEIRAVDMELGSYIEGEHSFAMKEAKSSSPYVHAALVEGADALAVYEGADAQARKLADIKPGTQLRTSKMIAGFARVQLAKDVFGFVDAKRLRLLSGKAEDLKGDPKGVEYAYVTAPVIAYDLDDPFQVVKADSLTIKGETNNPDKMKDVYIFCGDQKVLYQRAKDSNTLPFVATLPLKNGNNRVTIVARNSQKITSSTAFYVFASNSKLDPHKKENLRAMDEDVE